MIKWLAVIVACIVVFSVAISTPAGAIEIGPSEIGSSEIGASVFEAHCAGCHINGSNIVRRNKTLKLKALQRNQVDSLEAISQLVTNGKGNMPAYHDRLNEDEIRAVAAYVLEQAEKDWR